MFFFFLLLLCLSSFAASFSFCYSPSLFLFSLDLSRVLFAWLFFSFLLLLHTLSSLSFCIIFL